MAARSCGSAFAALLSYLLKASCVAARFAKQAERDARQLSWAAGMGL
jgi:hypothetical protein